MTKASPQPAWNVYAASCPTRKVLDCIADKWSMLVVGQLIGGTKRFGVLRRSIEGVSQKMLTQTLRSLERDGIVRRQIFASVPPRVDYSLTPLGNSLAGIVDALRVWSEINIERVIESQAAFDAAQDKA